MMLNRAVRRTVLGVAGVAAVALTTLGTAPANATTADTSAAVTPYSWFAATVGGAGSGGLVSLRDCYHPVQTPSQSCGLVYQVPTGTTVDIVCQASGQNIYGNSVWDYVVAPNGEGYMSDYYLFTNHDGFIPGVDRCS
jgi:hypothetical protein